MADEFSDDDPETMNLDQEGANEKTDQKEESDEKSFNYDDKTLFLPKFEKAEISFESIDDGKLDKEFIDIQRQIERVASKTLYAWKNCPIVFPKSITGIADSTEKEAKNNSFQINYSDLFQIPSFNELEEIATGPDGKTKRLDKAQLESVKRDGEFDVPSAHFPGTNHRWVLTQWLQKGYTKANHSFFSDMSKALWLMIVVAKRRFCSDLFSLKQGVVSWGLGLYRLLDLFIGVPHMKVIDYATRLDEDQRRYAVLDLVVDTKEQQNFENLCNRIDQAFNDKKRKKIYIAHEQVPYFFKTKEGLSIDLRLFDPVLWKSITPILQNILVNDKINRSWFVQMRKESFTRFKNEGLSIEEASEKTNKLVMDEYLRRVHEQLLSNELLEKKSPGIGQLLSEHCRVVTIMKQVFDELNEKMNKRLQDYENSLKKNYSIRSKVSEWLNDHIAAEREKFIKEHLFAAHVNSIERCKEEKLDWAAYFIERELNFLQKEQPELIKKYKKIKEPMQTFQFNRYIWLPRNYIIKRVDRTTAYGGPYYTMEKEVIYSNSTRRPFWRWINFFLRTFIYLSNSLWLFGLVIPFASPVSLRALFSVRPFCPGKRVNETTGELEPDPSSKTHTYCSRLRAIWQSVRDSRTKFESTPDKGLLGKTMTRFFNRVWNYIFKGFIGSLGLTLIYPAVCVFCSLGSLILAFTSPIWYPILSVLHHLAFLLLYDWDYPTYYRTPPKILAFLQTIIFRLLICGVLQPICALFTAFIFCPIASLTVTIFAIIRRVLRKIWDAFMYCLILRRHARVPSHDTFVAKRIKGPGLASSHFYQCKPEQILAAVEARLEVEVIDAYMSRVNRILSEPLSAYTRFFNPLFAKFSYSLSSSIGIYSRLSTNVNVNLDKYRDEANRRRNLLGGHMSNYGVMNQVRLNETDLKLILTESAKMVQKHYENSILKYKNMTVRQLMDSKGIEEDDWATFTGTYLESMFGTGFLTPLEQTDSSFSLEVNHLNLSRYTHMIAKAELRDDLDDVLTKYNPKRQHVAITMPSIDTGVLNPTVQHNYNYSHLPNKTSLASNITIPSIKPSDQCVTSVIVHNQLHPKNKIPFHNFRDVTYLVQYEDEFAFTKLKKSSSKSSL